MNITEFKTRIKTTSNGGKTQSLANHIVFGGQYPLDLTEIPMDTLADLQEYPSRYKFKGKKVTVLNTDTTNVMSEYWWTGSEWKECTNDAQILYGGDDVD